MSPLTEHPTLAAGFRHAAGLYSSERELLDLAVPFLQAGVAKNEPTLLGVDAQHRQLIREAMGDPPGLTECDDHYADPVRALKLNHEAFNEHVAAGAGRVRIVGEIDPRRRSWDGWVRYEAAINDLWSDLPVSAICIYDTRTTPVEVLSDVECTHPYLATTDAVPALSPSFVTPSSSFLAERDRAEIDPLEHTPPQLARTDPTPRDARAAVAALATSTSLDAAAADDLCYAVSEVIINAIVHGVPSVELRAWAAAHRVVVAVRDRGPGPSRPHTGMLRSEPAGGHFGAGLWLARQQCSRVSLLRDAGGFTARLVGGTPHGG